MKLETRNYIGVLKDRGLCPHNIEFSFWESWTLVSCFNYLSSHYISSSVAMGIDRDPEIALLKSITEFCERMVFRDASGTDSNRFIYSDGMAAFPAYYQNAVTEVRNRSLYEAVERFLWATWWDNLETYYNFEREIDFQEKNILINYFNLKSVTAIRVPDSNNKFELIILLAENKYGGYITGGAAGVSGEIQETFNRAFGELLRHLFVSRNMADKTTTNMSFYERRLFGFSSGEWSKLVRHRLSIKGTKKIVLPDLFVDETLPHQNSDIVSIYRCQFEKQPIFMGGDVKRLCI